ncbi:MAG: sensor histidine kinase [Pseudobdellovibrionaceae bacterium]
MSIAMNAEAAEISSANQSGAPPTVDLKNNNINIDPWFYKVGGVMFLIVYVAWGYACEYIFHTNEIMMVRWVTAIIALVPGVWAYFKSYNAKVAEGIWALVFLSAVLEMIYLCVSNNFHIVYLTGLFTTYIICILLNSLYLYLFSALTCVLSIPIFAYIFHLPFASWLSLLLQLVTFANSLGFFIYVKNRLSFNLVESLSKLNESEKNLAESSKMAAMATMAGGVAHEINNPVSIILGKAGIIKRMAEEKKSQDDKTIAAMDKIIGTVERIGKITKGLLIFSRNGDADPFIQKDANDLVSNSLELVQEKFKEKNIQLILNTQQTKVPEEKFNAMFFCKETQVVQLLFHLLNNAFDAVENLDEKWTKIDILPGAEKLTIKVTDSGKGIAPKVAEKMFLPFYSTKEVGKGTGMGLSISKGIVESHKGEFHYKLDEAGHTQFIAVFPKVQAFAAGIESPVSNAA